MMIIPFVSLDGKVCASARWVVCQLSMVHTIQYCSSVVFRYFLTTTYSPAFAENDADALVHNGNAELAFQLLGGGHKLFGGRCHARFGQL